MAHQDFDLLTTEVGALQDHVLRRKVNTPHARGGGPDFAPLAVEDPTQRRHVLLTPNFLVHWESKFQTITFNNNIKMTQIYQHQLDFVGQGIEDLVAQEFYTNSYNQSQMLTGISITFSNIAKFGFIVKDASKNPYKIVDPFGNDITDSFDYYYLDNVSYYLSKENVSYSTIPFKFQKNN